MDQKSSYFGSYGGGGVMKRSWKQPFIIYIFFIVFKSHILLSKRKLYELSGLPKKSKKKWPLLIYKKKWNLNIKTYRNFVKNEALNENEFIYEISYDNRYQIRWHSNVVLFDFFLFHLLSTILLCIFTLFYIGASEIVEFLPNHLQ